ncbi:hypothetical protein JCM11491_005859 [Sporobolomyces phaffii]
MTASSSGGDSNDDQFDWSTSGLSNSDFSIGGGRVDGSFYFPSLFGTTSAAPPPPPLPAAAPLLDSTEHSLFSTFLTTLDIDPKFLFNPILPPGMPSPPNPGLAPGNEDAWERDGLEREQLGRAFGTGLDLARADPRESVDDAEDRDGDGDGDGDDPDFDPEDDPDDPEYEGGTRRRPPRGGVGAGTRRKSRSGGVSGSAAVLDRARAGKKSRVVSLGSPVDEERDQDATMQESQEADDDPDYSERVPPPPPPAPASSGLVGSTRQKRARPSSTANSSRRNSTSSSTATTTTTTASTTPNRRPSSSLAKPPAEPTPQQVHQLSHSQKRQNHIESEQRRRNAIKVNFKDLVELVIRGQSLSGVILGPDVSPPDPDEDADEADGAGLGRGGKKRASAKKGKKAGAGGGAAAGRGRGRKGDTGANASKSVVLERARDYICWLEKGNQGLEREIARVEAALAEGA